MAGQVGGGSELTLRPKTRYPVDICLGLGRPCSLLTIISVVVVLSVISLVVIFAAVSIAFISADSVASVFSILLPNGLGVPHAGGFPQARL